MKISLNTVKWLNTHYGSADDVASIGVDHLVEKIGAQLGAVDEVIKLGEKYQGIVIVKVVSCEQHPDADKLKVCMVDAGRGENIQVVCGATNVRAGMLAAWLPPGSTVPDTVGKEPFVLEARELRGVVSNGMLASPKELALGDSHDGILEIDGDYKPGTDFAEAFGLQDDVVLDIENKMFTHRPDCFGTLGVARELAGIQHMTYKSPDWYVANPDLPEPEADALPLAFNNELPDEVPRFTAVTMRDVEVGPSPVWLQVELAKVGQKPINNIVDYTNYFMLETGQPLHAYDYDKVKALCQSEAAIVVRKPKPGEKVKLLNGKEIEPRADAIMIATDKQLIGIGGVMGGSETEVDENTKNIIIEAANFNMYSIRRTSMEHGLFTEAVTRFTKGQSPLQTKTVIAKIVDKIRNHAGGKVASTLLDDNQLDQVAIERNSVHLPVAVSVDFINTRLGLKLTADEIKALLENVEFAVDTSSEDLVVKAPFWRTDIELREDVVEEVGRLYGYDQLPLELPKRDLTPASRDPLMDLKSRIRFTLSKAGANEVINYSFIRGDLLDKVGQDKAQAFEISNALSPDLKYYRLSLIPSLLEKVHPNIKAGYDQFALFEIGKAHLINRVGNDGLPAADELTSLVVTAADKLKKAGAAYYQASQYLQTLVGQPLEFKPVPADMQKYDITKPFEINRTALVSLKGGDFLGIIGEFKPGVSRSLKLPRYTAGFEIDTSVLLGINAKKYVELPRFPKVSQDLTLSVPADTAYQTVFDFVWDEFAKVQPERTLPSLSPVDIYQKGDSQKNISLRLTLASYDRTLTDTEVNNLLDKVAAAAKTAINAERV